MVFQNMNETDLFFCNVYQEISEDKSLPQDKCLPKYLKKYLYQTFSQKKSANRITDSKEKLAQTKRSVKRISTK